MDQLIHSAALYCEREVRGHVSMAWLESVLHLFTSRGLRVREYTLPDNPICPENSYAFQDNDPQLIAAVQTGVLRELKLYCHATRKRDLFMRWDGIGTVNLSEGYVHVGVPATSELSLANLLLQTYTLARPMANWIYGIGYMRSTSKAPCMYAVGVIGGDFPYPDVRREDLDRVSCWNHELLGQRRHLNGCLRDVYPANLLSPSHIGSRVGKDKTLLTAGWGEFTQIDDNRWLWTVPDEEIANVRAALQPAGLLICP
jgi:hypothetical protein